MESQYLDSAKKQFLQYKRLGEGAMHQLSDDQLWWQANAHSNSVATIVKHLWGNMRSRFTDFLISDGEKPWRDRETEFDNDLNSREALLSRWNEGWNYLFSALEPLQEEDLSRTVLIRNEKHTVLEAVNRQLTHYAYHVGQIVFLSKMICEKWHSLSIPRGLSDRFNEEKFRSPDR